VPEASIAVAVVVGTRPEAIKMAPVVRALAQAPSLRPVVISTGQHRELLDGALAALEVRADVDLAVMRQAQSPNDVLARVVSALPPVLAEIRPAALLVQGDTTTVLGAALAGYHLGVPVGHVEAGLRTYDHAHPFPEEANRQLVDRLARWCFAPTAGAAENLASERIEAARVHVTGNTGIDSLLWAVGRSVTRAAPGTVLVTLHRRESFGGQLDEILLGVRDFLTAVPEARVLWPVHPNPNVAAAAERTLAGCGAVERVAPLPYVAFAGVLASCRLVLTDSGGIQEEGPSLGKTVLVARETTERPEAIEAGRNRVVGRRRADVAAALTRAWREAPYEGPVPAPSPFGDGHAARRIVETLERELA
jgi:UDP-N-acetylglucosamine 2-epimerase (non-hydrolysing)